MWGFESVTPRLIHGLCGNTKLNFSIKTDPSRQQWRQRNMSGVCALTRIHLAQGPGICTFYIMGLIFTPRFRFALGYGVTLPHPMHAILYCRKLKLILKCDMQYEKTKGSVSAPELYEWPKGGREVTNNFLNKL